MFENSGIWLKVGLIGLVLMWFVFRKHTPDVPPPPITAGDIVRITQASGGKLLDFYCAAPEGRKRNKMKCKVELQNSEQELQLIYRDEQWQKAN
ncbi:hypothetical protein LNQ82_03350 [Conchiformibius steedae DSM 2580]|uniref:Uncharacterized protein n=2 Tax=Conchiformibius steedae TaxID=153493 RepID=A0A3P2A3I6_9NEIS|nr:hypothetical protein [Conchiformibius steedae]QMT33552.1 hypothetical protein H3L98_00420 [Conchiformibius steedae]RRD89488.1 hypothetical protein EII21_08850 [Conchiformibius steedae]URD68211.1 hypothetical protein LNQ82_03350 [Conchiformibius steedae DSM 2580]